MGMRKICDGLLRAALVFYLFWVALAAVLMLFFERQIGYSNKKYFCMNNFLLFFLACVAVCVFLGAGKFIVSRCRRIGERDGRGFFLFSFFFFLFQIYFCYNTRFRTGWDVDILQSNADIIALEMGNEYLSHAYFSQYPNNVFLVFLFSVLKRLDRAAGILDALSADMLILTVQCLLSSLTGLLIFRLAYRWGNAVWAWLAWIFYFILLGSSGWLLIPYSDSMGLFFPIAILSLYVSMEDKKRLGWKLLGLTLLTYWGYHIKPQVAIVMIAVLLVEVLNVLSGREGWVVKSLLHPRAVVVPVALIVSVILYGQLEKSTGIMIDREGRFGMSHFFMMGLNESSQGNYSDSDVQFSAGFETVRERKKANWEKSLERIREMGAKGLWIHTARKLLNNYGDGTYGWELNEGFCREMPELKNMVVSGFFRNTIIGLGESRSLSEAVRQGAWLFILVFSPGLFAGVGRDNRALTVLMVSLLGLTMFLLIFEANARYLYIYVPLYIIAGVLGTRETIRCVGRIKNMVSKNLRKRT